MKGGVNQSQPPLLQEPQDSHTVYPAWTDYRSYSINAEGACADDFRFGMMWRDEGTYHTNQWEARVCRRHLMVVMCSLVSWCHGGQVTRCLE